MREARHNRCRVHLWIWSDNGLTYILSESDFDVQDAGVGPCRLSRLEFSFDSTQRRRSNRQTECIASASRSHAGWARISDLC